MSFLRNAARSLRARAKLLVAGARFRPTVLMYHSIGRNGVHFTVPPEAFRRQMSWLRSEGFEVVGLEECVRRGRAGERGKVAALTFDDGYRDFLEHAWPVLEEFGFPSTVFLITGRMGASYTSSGGESLPLLSWEEAARLEGRGVSFGSHTRQHPKLTKVPEGEARQELEGSWTDLAERLERPSRFFCYPHGRTSAALQEAVRAAGYEGAVTVAPGHPGPDTPPFAVPRAYMHSEMGWAEFRAGFVA